MIGTEYVRRMARYNRWQNVSLYTAAERLSDEARRADRRAFFGSLHATLNHLLWADQMWMWRFAGTPRPPGGIAESTALHADWADLQRARADFDSCIVAWADGLDADWLTGDLTYVSGAANAEMTKPKWFLVTHFFNHQTHHRGQVHCLLTQAGVRPGDTDLPFMKKDQAAC